MNTNGQNESTLTDGASTSSTIHEIGARLGDVKDQIGDRGSAVIGNAGRLIKQHPFAAVGIAFGVGALAMLMLRRG